MNSLQMQWLTAQSVIWEQHHPIISGSICNQVAAPTHQLTQFMCVQPPVVSQSLWMSPTVSLVTHSSWEHHIVGPKPFTRDLCVSVSCLYCSVLECSGRSLYHIHQTNLPPELFDDYAKFILEFRKVFYHGVWGEEGGNQLFTPRQGSVALQIAALLNWLPIWVLITLAIQLDTGNIIMRIPLACSPLSSIHSLASSRCSWDGQLLSCPYQPRVPIWTLRQRDRTRLTQLEHQCGMSRSASTAVKKVTSSLPVRLNLKIRLTAGTQTTPLRQVQLLASPPRANQFGWRGQLLGLQFGYHISCPLEPLEEPLEIHAIDGKFLALARRTNPLHLILSGNHREHITF